MEQLARDEADRDDNEELLRASAFSALEAAQQLAWLLLGRPLAAAANAEMLQRFADLYDALDLAQQQLRIMPSDIQQFRFQQSERDGRLKGRYLWRL